MRICVAQSESIKGNIEHNLKKHLSLIDRAISERVDLIIFPELSITNYEPTIATDFAKDLRVTVLSVLQKTSNSGQLSIGVGLPTQSHKGNHISMLIIRPNEPPQTYSKQILHSDEEPFFVGGEGQNTIELMNSKIGLSICYESLQEEHLKRAKKLGAEIYIASTTMSKKGTDKALKHYETMAKKHRIPILMSNSVGFCDGFKSVGQSSIWDGNGKLLGKMDAEHEGLLIFDTRAKEVEKL